LGPELYVVNVDGSEKRLLAKGPPGGSDTAWSPGGRTIAFASYSRVLFVNADGSGRRNVTREWGSTAFLSGRPTGRRSRS
jgi:Tol biopolymer transport system component